MESFEELLLRLAEHGNDFDPELLIVIFMIMRLLLLLPYLQTYLLSLLLMALARVLHHHNASLAVPFL